MRSIIKKKQKMKKFRIDELSSVDRPAQQAAQALIMKRRGEEGDKVEKIGWITVVTSADSGHGHVLELYAGEDRNGHTDVAVGVGDDAEEHRHAWYIDDDGQIDIVMNAGHLHAVERDVVVNAVVAMVQKQDLDEELLGKIQKNFPEIGIAATPTQEDIQMDEELKKANERLTTVVALSASHRAHFDTIEKAEDQDVFLAKSADERELLVAPVEKTEPKEEVVIEKNEDPNVVYTAADGTVFTKSDDPRLVAAIVGKDAGDAKIAALQLEKSDGEFEKRAEKELANLPGTVAQRAELLKSVEGIENPEHREAALKALKAGNSASEDVTKSLGTSEGAKVEKTDEAHQAGAQIQKTEFEVKLNDLAKAEAIKLDLDPVKDFAKAYSIVVNSDEGKDLYNQHRNAMIKRIA